MNFLRLKGGEMLINRRPGLVTLVWLLQQLRGVPVTELLWTAPAVLQWWIHCCNNRLFLPHVWYHCTASASDVLVAWEPGTFMVTEQLSSLKRLRWHKLHQEAESPLGGSLLQPQLHRFLHVKIFLYKFFTNFSKQNLTRVSNPSHKLSVSKWFGRVEEFLIHGFTLYHILGHQEKEQPTQESIISVLVCDKPRRICEIGAQEKPAPPNSISCETVCFNCCI